jgi:hypothetical protein
LSNELSCSCRNGPHCAPFALPIGTANAGRRWRTVRVHARASRLPHRLRCAIVSEWVLGREGIRHLLPLREEVHVERFRQAEGARRKHIKACAARRIWPSALGGPDHIFMDCSATGGRPARVRQAIAAGKHVHIEKPTAPTVEEAMELARLADKAGVRHGVIQDKLFLPGFAQLLFVKKADFFGRILSIKIDAGSMERRRSSSGRAGTTNAVRAAASRSI